MDIFHYHPDTGVYLGASVADENPLDPTSPLIPAFATTEAPPTEMIGFVRRFVDGAWGHSPVEAPETPPLEEPPPYVPPEISDRQFFQQLAIDGLITQQAAILAVRTGELPAEFVAMIDALPEHERFGATMLLSGATSFRRGHPLTDAFGAANGMTPVQIDDLWRRAAAL